MSIDFRSQYDRKEARNAGVDLELWAAKRENGEKWCRKCRRWAPLDQYWKDRSSRDQRQSVCVFCKRVNTGRANIRWSPEERQVFLKLVGRYSSNQIAEKMGRTSNAIKAYAHQQGWSLRLGEGSAVPYGELKRLLNIRRDTFKEWIHAGLLVDRSAHPTLVRLGSLKTFWKKHPEYFDVEQLCQETLEFLEMDLERWPEVPAFKVHSCQGFEGTCKGENTPIKHPRVWFLVDTYQTQLGCPVCAHALPKHAEYYADEWFDPVFTQTPPLNIFSLPRKSRKGWKNWTDKEIRTLKTFFGLVSGETLGHLLQRTEQSVHSAASNLNLPEQAQEDWQRWGLLNSAELSEILAVSRARVDAYLDKGLAHYPLPKHARVSLGDLRRWLLEDRPEALPIESLPEKSRELLGLIDLSEDQYPPNFKYIYCSGYESRKFPGVKVTHSPVWVCLDLYKVKGTCPVCNRNLPRWADAYAEDFVDDLVKGKKLPEGAWKAKKRGRLQADVLYLIQKRAETFDVDLLGFPSLLRSLSESTLPLPALSSSATCSTDSSEVPTDLMLQHPPGTLEQGRLSSQSL